jgi:hypothetical protein
MPITTGGRLEIGDTAELNSALQEQWSRSKLAKNQNRKKPDFSLLRRKIWWRFSWKKYNKQKRTNDYKKRAAPTRERPARFRNGAT